MVQGDELFSDDFEDGTLDAWSVISGTPSINDTEQYRGTYCAELGGIISYYSSQSEVWVREYLKWNVTLVHPQSRVFIQARYGGVILLEFGQQHENPNLNWRYRFLNGSSMTSWIPSALMRNGANGTYQMVEYHMKMSSTATSADGEIHIWINGTELTDLTQTNVNFTQTEVSHFYMADGGSSWRDNFVIDNAGYIGPAPTTPLASDMATNSTYAGEVSEFSTKWTDQDEVNMSGHIFGTNNTGVWVNETLYEWTPMTTPAWGNVTFVLNETIGIVVAMEQWAKDSDNQWSDTGMQYLTVTNPVTISNIEHPRWGLYNESTIDVELNAAHLGSGTIDKIWWNLLNGSIFVYEENMTYTVPTTMTGITTDNDYTFTAWANDTNGVISSRIDIQFMVDTNAFEAENGTAEAIQAAVDLAIAAGGGNVTIPAGVFNFTIAQTLSDNHVESPPGVNIFGAPNKRTWGEYVPNYGLNPNGMVTEWNTILQLSFWNASETGPGGGINNFWFEFIGDGSITNTSRISDIQLNGYREINASTPQMTGGIEMNDVLLFRVDHMYFKNLAGIAVRAQGSNSVNFSGVVDHCRIENPAGGIAGEWDDRTLTYGISVGRGSTAPLTAWENQTDIVLGQMNRYTIFVENNNFSKWRHCITINHGGHYVLRFNTFDADYGYGSIDIHGANQVGELGTRAIEVYNNSLINSVVGSPTAIFFDAGGAAIFNNYVDESYTNNFMVVDAVASTPDFGRPMNVWFWDNDYQGGGNFINVQNGPFSENVEYFLRTPDMVNEGWTYTSYSYPHPLTIFPVPDEMPPTWIESNSSETSAESICELSVLWEKYDGYLSSYKIEHNGTGTFQNITDTFTGSPKIDWSNETITLPEEGKVVMWRAHASGSPWASTTWQYITVTEAASNGWEGKAMGIINPSKIMGVDLSVVMKVNKID